MDATRKHNDVPDSDKKDSEILFKIKQYLRKEHHIPFDQIKTEVTIRITRECCEMLGKLDSEEISQIRGLIHTPDVIVTDKDGKPLFIVEQDGRIHESEEQMKKDAARNRHYARAGIPCIVLNTKEIRSAGVTLGAYLDRELEKMEMAKPVGLNPPFSPGS